MNNINFGKLLVITIFRTLLTLAVAFLIDVFTPFDITWVSIGIFAAISFLFAIPESAK
jgi:hypothetical protein